MGDGLHVTEERRRRELLHLLPGRPANGDVGGDEAHDLVRAVLGREAFQERVGVRRITHLERAVRLVRPAPVEHEHPSRAFQGHEAGELVAELPQVLVAPGVEKVVPVEQVERRLSHAASSPRREGRRPQR